ncbi:transcriptional regulator [Rothia nasimurium]|uniref:Transcriptional regulator n=1 Tax=Rothia nasimurium TaxID=85336 RepID=A0A4Y9F7Z0_9MICC|nr:helix-turn-helix transcriptional regulator [Rothia nasimurium]MBF0807592.1 helix-turn-helix transcriptional regulator [Rothia nasimurium]TFU23522.1 transcriptional regulator [Rothia nasimurium]
MQNQLKELRAGRGYSQQQLADVLGVSRQTVISIEKGRFDPSLPLAFQLAEVFGCRIEDIFFPIAPENN